MNRAELKSRARTQLGGGIFANAWLMSVVLMLIVSAISYFANAITLLLAGFIGVATMAFFKNVVRNSTGDLNTAFSSLKQDIGGTLLLGILQTVFVALWSLLFVIPGIVKTYAYSMAYYLKDEHPEWDWRQCLSESQRLMNGHKMELFILDLSFIGWYIVGSLALGAGTLWVSAYHNTTRVNYFEDLTSVA